MPSSTGHVQNYNELLDRIVKELARGDVRVDAVGWIAAAELEIFRDCDPKPADLKTTGTLTAGQTVLTLPKRTTQIHLFQLNLSPARTVVNRALAETVHQREIDSSGVPKYYNRQGQTLELGPGNGNAGTNYTLWYHGLPENLSEENQSNAIFELGWDAYLYGALYHGASYFGGHANQGEWEKMWLSKKASLADLFWDMDAGEPLESYSPQGTINDSHSEY